MKYIYKNVKLRLFCCNTNTNSYFPMKLIPCRRWNTIQYKWNFGSTSVVFRYRVCPRSGWEPFLETYSEIYIYIYIYDMTTDRVWYGSAWLILNAKKYMRKKNNKFFKATFEVKNENVILCQNIIIKISLIVFFNSCAA